VQEKGAGITGRTQYYVATEGIHAQLQGYCTGDGRGACGTPQELPRKVTALCRAFRGLRLGGQFSQTFL